MSIDNQPPAGKQSGSSRIGILPNDPAREARDRWREHPEVNTLGEADGFVTYYVTDPNDEQFHDTLSLSVATCGNSILVPEEDYVLLSLDGLERLVNALITPDEARKLAKLLKKAAKKAAQ
jgi:hypothetical protein